MAKRDIVVIGASAGGVTALRELVSGLPPGFAATVFVVQHLSAHAPSYLPDILSRSGPLRAVHPKDGEAMQPGLIYVAPPDHHLLVEAGHVVVRRGPKENRFRPSIDALFRSAAYTYGPRVIGVVLTGLLDDGTSGMWSIKRLGGLGIVQAPDDALFANMPQSVLEYVDVDYKLPMAAMAARLVELVEETVPDPAPLSPEEERRLATETRIAAEGDAFGMGILDMGQPTTLTCPECNGVLIGITEGKLMRYRCHTGHGFTADALLAELTKSIEETEWQVLRGLEEKIMLLEQSGQRFIDVGEPQQADRFFQKARAIRRKTALIRELIYENGVSSNPSIDAP